MAYDYHWNGSPPGPIAPIGWVRSVISYARTQIPASRLVLGNPLSGYDGPAVTPRTSPGSRLSSWRLSTGPRCTTTWPASRPGSAIPIRPGVPMTSGSRTRRAPPRSSRWCGSWASAGCSSGCTAKRRPGPGRSCTAPSHPAPAGRQSRRAAVMPWWSMAVLVFGLNFALWGRWASAVCWTRGPGGWALAFRTPILRHPGGRLHQRCLPGAGAGPGRRRSRPGRGPPEPAARAHGGRRRGPHPGA